jgi:hypothetical protein
MEDSNESVKNMSVNIMNNLEKIVSFNRGQCFWHIRNTVGQEWFFPIRNICLFLSLFQPSSIKGKVVVLLFPFLKYVPFLRSKLNTESIRLDLKKEIKDSICSVFQVQDFEYAIFCGSPGRHQKLTLMIAADNRCLGYCKISGNKDVIMIFKQEEQNLNYLKSKYVRNIPVALYCGKLKNDTYLFAQTTDRTTQACIADYKNREVIEFIENMKMATVKNMKYEDTDYYETIRQLKELSPLFISKEEHSIFYKTIKNIEDKLSRTNYEYSAYHGDLTPWNSFIIKRQLFAFDFEYFKKTYPIYMDYFHFFTQSCIYNKFWDERQTATEYFRIKKSVLANLSNADFTYCCYLLSIMAFYLIRDNGFLNKRIRDCFDIWIGLLNIIVKKNEFES